MPLTFQKRTRVTGCNSMPFGACPVTSWISSKKPSPRSVIHWCTCFQLVVAWSRATNVLRAAAICERHSDLPETHRACAGIVVKG